MTEPAGAATMSQALPSAAHMQRCRACFQPTPLSSLHEHPLGSARLGLPSSPALCTACLHIYTADAWAWRTDANGKDVHCRLCGEGDLGRISCDRSSCTYTFCEGCLLANCGKRNAERIMRLAEKGNWHCFACTNANNANANTGNTAGGRASGSSSSRAAASRAAAAAASSPAAVASAAVNRMRTHLHLTARAAAGEFTKRTFYNVYALRRPVPEFTYFDRDKLAQLRREEARWQRRRQRRRLAKQQIVAAAVAAGVAAAPAAAAAAALPVAAAAPPRSSPFSTFFPRKGAQGPSSSSSAAVVSRSRMPSNVLALAQSAPSAAAASDDGETDLDEDEEVDFPPSDSEDEASAVAGKVSPAAAAPCASPAPVADGPVKLKRLICFSFFLHELHHAEEHTPYVYGLLENLRRVHAGWGPGWTVRIYVDESFAPPAPMEARGTAPLNGPEGIICNAGYHAALGRAWNSLLLPLFKQLESAGILVEVRRFRWPHLMDRDGVHHGLVGTFARFLALAELGLEGGVEQVVMADTDNFPTQAVRDLYEHQATVHQRFHDPRYPVPCWAGGFAVRVPRDVVAGGAAALRAWVNPYARIEQWIMAWAHAHVRDPTAIYAREEMFRVDPALMPGVGVATVAEDAEAQKKRLRRRDEEEAARLRDRNSDERSPPASPTATLVKEERSITPSATTSAAVLSPPSNSSTAASGEARGSPEHKEAIRPGASSLLEDDDDCVEILPPPGSAAAPPPATANATGKRGKKHRGIATRRSQQTQRKRAGVDDAAELQSPLQAEEEENYFSNGAWPVGAARGSLVEPKDGEGSLVFFGYGCDQVFLSDYVWPIMRDERGRSDWLTTTYVLLITKNLARELRVWPPVLTEEQQHIVATAPKYWSLYDWMPTSARPSPTGIELFVKTFLRKHFGAIEAALLAATTAARTNGSTMKGGLLRPCYEPLNSQVQLHPWTKERVHADDVVVPFATKDNARWASPDPSPSPSSSSSSSVALLSTSAASKKPQQQQAAVRGSTRNRTSVDPSSSSSPVAVVSVSLKKDKQASSTSAGAAGVVTIEVDDDDHGVVTTKAIPRMPVHRSTGRKVIPIKRAASSSNSASSRSSGSSSVVASSPKAKRSAALSSSVTAAAAARSSSRLKAALPAEDDDDRMSDSGRSEDRDDPLVLNSLPPTPSSASSSSSASVSAGPSDGEEDDAKQLSSNKAKPASARKRGAPAPASGRKSDCAPVPSPAKRAKTETKQNNNDDNASPAVAESSRRAVTSRDAKAQGPAAKLLAQAIAAAVHNTTDCEWGCMFLHDARKCLGNSNLDASSDSAQCAHREVLLQSSETLRAALTQSTTAPLDVSMPMADVAPAVSVADSPNDEQPPTGAAAAVSSLVVASSAPDSSAKEESKAMDESEPTVAAAAASDDAARLPSAVDPAAAPVTPQSTPPASPQLRSRSARNKKIVPLLGDYVMQINRFAQPPIVASHHHASSAASSEPRVQCKCTCTFCAPHLPQLPVVATGTKLFHARLGRSAAWPWDGATAGQWLGSLHSDAFLPLQCLLLEKPKCASTLLPPGILQLLHSHPLKLLKLLRQAQRAFGGTPPMLELLAWSLYDHLQTLIQEITTAASAVNAAQG